MRGRSWAAIGGIFLSLALCSTASAQFSPGARSLGDAYYASARQRRLRRAALRRDDQLRPARTHFNVGEHQGRRARATQGLSEFSLDFVELLRRRRASRSTARRRPSTRDVDAGTYKYKLVVTPAAGIANGSTFTVVVDYSGTPQNFLDPDDSFEGFMRTTPSTGAFVMNEPVGAMGWFPNNNHPDDKATYDFHLTAPDAYDAIGNGELVVEGRQRQRHDDLELEPRPIRWRATSRRRRSASSTTPRTRARPRSGASGQPLKLYDFIESALPDTGTGTANKANNNTQRVRQDEIVKYIADTIGAPYPFDSHGVVAGTRSGRAAPTRSRSRPSRTSAAAGSASARSRTRSRTSGSATASVRRRWREIWFNEGWATWWATWWSNKQNGSPTHDGAVVHRATTTTTNPSNWSIAPDAPPGPGSCSTPSRSTRVRRMAFEGYRQIVGDTAFFAFQKALVTEYALRHDHRRRRSSRWRGGSRPRRPASRPRTWPSSTSTGSQWISTPSKPTLTPTTFFQSTSVPGPVSGTVPPTLVADARLERRLRRLHAGRRRAPTAPRRRPP